MKLVRRTEVILKMGSQDKDEKKFMDVAKPGKSQPDATSRPVIVGHRPMVHDPMVSDLSGAKNDKPEEEKKLVSSAGIKILPLSESEAAEKVEPAKEPESEPEPTAPASEETQAEPDKPAETAKVPEPAAEEKPAEKLAAPEPAPEEVAEAKPAETPKPAPETAVADNAVVNAVASQAGAKKKPVEGEVTEEDKAKQEAIQKLIESKKYNVKVGEVKRRRSRHGAVALIVLLLALIGVYLALDARLIESNLELPYEFFK